MLEKRQQLPQDPYINADYFIYCLEGVDDIETDPVTEAQKNLEQLTLHYGMASIYFTYPKDLFIQNKKPWRFFLKPEFVMAFPNFPTLTGYFLLEVGVAYKLRQF